jgi:hypothetical protein
MVNWKTLISILFINLSARDETISGYHIAIEVTNEVNAQKLKIAATSEYFMQVLVCLNIYEGKELISLANKLL